MSEPATPEARRVRLTMDGVVRGARSMAFALVSVFLFAMAYGVAARTAGLEGWVAVLLSAGVFAGASQFASLELLGGSTIPWIPLALVVFAVNGRHILMGAALYPWFGRVPFRQRLLPAALMTDINWAHGVQAYDQGERDLGVLLGSGLILWVTWVLGTAAGAALVNVATVDPGRLGLDLVFLLFFVCMLTGLRRERPDDIAWFTAGITAFAATYLLPPHWHVLTGAVAGGVAGMIVHDRRTTARAKAEAAVDGAGQR